MATVRSGEAELYYEVHGDGPALVFAHGRGGNAAIWWQQVPHFARTHKVIVFDHRMFGRSVGGEEAFNPPQMAADLLAILDAEGVERAAIVAQSMGGWTGLNTALRHPERVRCLVMTATYGGLRSPALEGKLAELTLGAGAPPISTRALALDFPAREPALALLYAHVSRLE